MAHGWRDWRLIMIVIGKKKILTRTSTFYLTDMYWVLCKKLIIKKWWCQYFLRGTSRSLKLASWWSIRTIFKLYQKIGAQLFATFEIFKISGNSKKIVYWPVNQTFFYKTQLIPPKNMSIHLVIGLNFKNLLFFIKNFIFLFFALLSKK